jgi:glucose/arabinose dehydrogenase
MGIEEPIIVARGLRNPFTMASFPGGVIIGDVGDETYEELNLMPFGSDSNFGWPLAEGPGEDFDNPLVALRHCDEFYENQDPVGHVKNHAGVVHECGGNTITAIGFYDSDLDPYDGALDNTVLYSDVYYGFIRGIALDGGNDRHLAHFSGIVASEIGPDGYLYAVSLFASNHVLKLIPNPEAH